MTYKYLYLLNSKGITSSRLRLYPEGFLNLKFLKPPKDEQQHIVNWLKNATASLGAAITRNYKEIDLIREYRTRLISDVVTGKMDVRHLAPSPGSEDLEETVEALEPLEEDIAADMMNDEDPVNEAD
jgi:type I restriction enzyme S subunit